MSKSLGGKLICEEFGFCSIGKLQKVQIPENLRKRLGFVTDVIKDKRKLEEVLHPIFVLLTHSEGFGFNRVVFFVVEGPELKNFFALGPRDHVEGLDMYSRLSKISFEDCLKNVEATLNDTSKLRELFETIRLYSKDAKNPVCETIDSGNCCILTYTRAKDERAYSILTTFGSTALAIVPMHLEGLGVKALFLVDNVVTLSPIERSRVDILSKVLDVFKPHIERAYLFKVIEEKDETIRNLRSTIEEKQSHIIAMERLNIARELTSSIVHEIRNPVTIIGGYASKLLRLIEDGNMESKSEMLKEIANAMYVNSLRIDNILRSLDDLNATLKARKIRLNICYLARKVVKEMTRKFKDLRVHMEIPDTPIYVEGDPVQMAKFIENAIINAYEASLEKEVKDPVVVRIKKEDSHVDLTIEDKAGGIPEDILSRVYEPFFTTKPHGSGLGIPVMLMIAKEHRATMKIENTGVGARVVLAIPERLEVINGEDSSSR